MASEDFEHSAAYVIGIARELHAHVAKERTGPEMPVGRSIREYVLKCEPKFTKIEIFSVPLGTDGDPAVRAALTVTETRGERRARIAYAGELNRCWSRFVVCKELMHFAPRPGQRPHKRCGRAAFCDGYADPNSLTDQICDELKALRAG